MVVVSSEPNFPRYFIYLAGLLHSVVIIENHVLTKRIVTEFRNELLSVVPNAKSWCKSDQGMVPS